MSSLNRTDNDLAAEPDNMSLDTVKVDEYAITERINK